MARALLIGRHTMNEPRRTTRRAKHDAGFTLVELAVVVAIVGILAVIAVVAYRRYILHAKITEARNVISAIRIAQEDYRAERGSYADLGGTYCPTLAGNGNHKTGWDPECSGAGTHPDPKWHTLPVHIDGPVHFQYATVAGMGAGGTAFPPTNASWVNWGAAAPTGHWYVVMAKCDLDGAGTPDTELVGSSLSNDIFSRNDGN